MTKTIKELTIEELNNVVTDLEKGVRYNDVKAKYNLASNAVNANTIAECKKLIAEMTPAPTKSFTEFFGVKHTSPEEHKKLIARGVTVDENGYYCW